jgi:pimeloyl-ACP methyl ester carboxylesterase
MGGVVAQCYIARHPRSVGGVVNLDGFPHPFELKAAKFTKAGRMYRLLSSLVWTGVVRVMVAFMARKGIFRSFASTWDGALRRRMSCRCFQRDQAAVRDVTHLHERPSPLLPLLLFFVLEL